MSFDNQETVITVRGKDFPLTPVSCNEDVQNKINQGLILALYALGDPRVDEVLKKFKIVFVWPNKKETRLFEPEA